jgi:hypothetical protein
MGNSPSSPSLSLPSLKLTILQILIYIFVPLGPLYSRVVDFNGSFDRPWLLFIPFFNFFPFSIVSVLMMAFGLVAPGKGGAPYDNLMWIPIISRLFIVWICQKILGDDSIIASVLTLIITIISIMIPNIVRRIKECPPNTFNSAQTFKVIIDSILELGCGKLFSSFLSFIPFVGMAFRVIELIPILGKLIDTIKWSVGFFITYIVVNMYNQINMNTLCQPTGTNSSDIAKLVIGILFTIIGSVI